METATDTRLVPNVHLAAVAHAFLRHPGFRQFPYA